MTTAQQSYWDEALSNAFEGAEAYDLFKQLTKEQRASIASDLEISHEHYGMAFYSPSWSDRFQDIEREYKEKYKQLEREFENYKNNAETAVKIALRQYSDAQVSIGEHGEVTRYGGRITQIQ